MRKRLIIGLLGILPAALSLLSGCTGMVEAELDQTHAKLAALQALAASVNKDLTTLDLIVAQLDEGHTILPDTFVETEDGYEVSFRDGKKIFIPFGMDGVDGRTLIPIGVKDEDGIYYWTVDGEWLLDAEGNKIRAGADQGVDGIAPQIKVEDGFWWISTDGGVSFERLASCEDMDGVGVFSGAPDLSDPAKIILTLWDGSKIELPCRLPLKLSFSGTARDTVLIAGGETLSIPYELTVEGSPEKAPVVTTGTDGTYFSRLTEGSEPGKGFVRVTAPDPFTEGYLLLSATCDGYSALKMITFRPREIVPAASSVTVRLGSGNETRTIPYKTNFEYTLSDPDADWLQAIRVPGTDSLCFTASPNTGGEIRSCTVSVSPKDNPGYVCTTFQVKQATNNFTYELEAGTAFLFNPDIPELTAPAEGGDAVLWITMPMDLTASVPGDQNWIQAELSAEDGFHRLRIHVEGLPSEESRSGDIVLAINDGAFPIRAIKITQKR